MDWFVFVQNYGCVFQCPDDIEGKDKTIEFITEEMEREFGVGPEDTYNYWIVQGEEKTFAPPSSKGDLI